GGRELAAVPGHPVQRLQTIDELPRFAAAQQSHGKAHRVEGDVVLAHELDIGDIVSALGQPPPSPPRTASRIRPLRGRSDVFDRRVEPDIEDLVLEARTGAPVLRDRNPPTE